MNVLAPPEAFWGANTVPFGAVILVSPVESKIAGKWTVYSAGSLALNLKLGICLVCVLDCPSGST